MLGATILRAHTPVGQGNYGFKHNSINNTKISSNLEFILFIYDSNGLTDQAQERF